MCVCFSGLKPDGRVQRGGGKSPVGVQGSRHEASASAPALRFERRDKAEAGVAQETCGPHAPEADKLLLAGSPLLH